MKLSAQTLAELPQRLKYSAERFYYAAILTCAPFDAANVHRQRPHNADSAAKFALSGPKLSDFVITPPLVLFGFSIELYLKLLICIAQGTTVKVHKLLDLFLRLEEIAPKVAEEVIERHRNSRGDRLDFIEAVTIDSNVFEDWRYSHEKEFLCSSADSLMALADAFRETVNARYPYLKSAFVMESNDQ
jgi:HEPN domain-containing protein